MTDEERRERRAWLRERRRRWRQFVEHAVLMPLFPDQVALELRCFARDDAAADVRLVKSGAISEREWRERQRRVGERHLAFLEEYAAWFARAQGS